MLIDRTDLFLTIKKCGVLLFNAGAGICRNLLVLIQNKKIYLHKYQRYF